MTTGEPGTDAEVTNSGTDSDVILDFVIPRGEPGADGVPDVLATIDSSGQTSTTGGALIFHDTPLVSGSAITHQPGSSDVEINRSGIYQAAFHSTAAVSPGTSIPATVTVRLYLNGTSVAGATARHTFTASDEFANLSFNVPFRVDAVPAIVQVVTSADGFVFSDIALTIVRLGDSSSAAASDR